jgi:predicted metal-dependent hydrolase
MRKRIPWILKKVGYFKEAQPEKSGQKEYVSGESYKYLGKQYRLKVFEADAEGVKYVRGFIHLFVKDKTDYNRKELLLNKWFRERAASVFHNSLVKMYLLIEKYGVKKPEITIKTMKARWGSCQKDKSSILLNFELIKAPKYCIDYVVLHELIHFLHRNHDEKFCNFLTALMPDWKMRKKILDEEVIRNL